MHQKILGLLLCSLLVVMVGCKKPAKVQSSQAQVSPVDQSSNAAKFDACALLKNQEIEAVMGSPIKETKPSGRADSGMVFSQCFYTAAEFSRSVSLSVTQSDPASAVKRSAKQFWEETFGRYDKEEKEREGDKEKKESLRDQKGKGEEGESVPPKKINGVGDEAYWIGSRVGGALYVLKKNAFVRISVGGPDKEETRIEKSKALAQKAIERL